MKTIRAIWAVPLIAVGGVATAEDRPTYSLYGTTGLIEMPNGRMAPEGEVAITVGGWGDQRRNNFTFQITPRLTATFRYTRVDNFSFPGDEEYFDRSFDIAYQVVRETDRWPSVTVGMRDFLGTGLYSSEYIVASKSIGDRLSVSGGLGWGRLGSRDGVENPLAALDDYFEDRPPIDYGEGGELTTDQWFRGDVAFFGGVEYRLNDKLSFEVEYSSDAYTRAGEAGTFEPESPFNFGVNYRPNENFELSAYYLYGSDLGLSATFSLNPHQRPTVGGREPAPLPIRPRYGAAAASWQSAQPETPIIRDARLQVQAMGTILSADGIRLIAMNTQGTSVRVQVESNRYRSIPQVIGHVARALTHVMPPEVETFVIEPVEQGIPLSSVTLMRSDLERLENAPGATQISFQRAIIAEAGRSSDDLYPVAPSSRLTWGLAPYVSLSTFDADQPLLGDFGVEISGAYEFAPNLVLSGAIRQRLAGNLSDSRNVRESGLPRVRSDVSQYNQTSTALDYLTLAYYFRPGDDLYGRVTFGYMESMFGGVSTELLWKPVGSRLAIGAEVNHVAQREFDQGFGFQDYTVTTGHVSAYYDFDNGFHGQVDVGRYLAGDWGATFALDREFANGWRIGGYFTLTDVSAEDFGEGSFDKGIRVTIPTDWFLGVPTRREQTTVLRSLTRDGGARLNVDGRLYGTVRDAHEPTLEDGWGRFWR